MPAHRPLCGLPRSFPLALPLALTLALPLSAPAEARVGQPLAVAAAHARRARVPSATFAVRDGVVMLEIWRSYVGDDHRRGPSWTAAQAKAMRRALAGGQVPVREAIEPVSWASFPVPRFHYGDGTTLVYVNRARAPRTWMIVAGGRWAWETPFQYVELACEGWSLVGGKLTRRKTASW